MKIFWLALTLGCIPLAQGCSAFEGPLDTGKVEASSTDEDFESQIIYDKIKAAIAEKDFAALNAMEREYRTSRAKTPSGLWKLAAFHAGVQFYLHDGLRAEEGCVYRKSAFVQDWEAADSGQPGAFITDAALLDDQGWCLRGTGYVNQVSQAAMAGFHEAMETAYRVLDANRDMASVDPEYYAVMANLYRGLGVKRARFNIMLLEATKREPYYHRTYFNAAWYYLPQWNGSYAEVDAFAHFAADHTKASDKTGFYARVYWSLEQCGCDLLHNAADWDDMKVAMADVYERYPVPHNAEYFMKLSCRMGDADEGLRYIRALSPEATSDADLVLRVESCRMMAES